MKTVVWRWMERDVCEFLVVNNRVQVKPWPSYTFLPKNTSSERVIGLKFGPTSDLLGMEIVHSAYGWGLGWGWGWGWGWDIN